MMAMFHCIIFVTWHLSNAMRLRPIQMPYDPIVTNPLDINLHSSIERQTEDTLSFYPLYHNSNTLFIRLMARIAVIASPFERSARLK
jgi:hypothetical protein